MARLTAKKIERIRFELKYSSRPNAYNISRKFNVSLGVVEKEAENLGIWVDTHNTREKRDMVSHPLPMYTREKDGPTHKFNFLGTYYERDVYAYCGEGALDGVGIMARHGNEPCGYESLPLEAHFNGIKNNGRVGIHNGRTISYREHMTRPDNECGRALLMACGMQGLDNRDWYNQNWLKTTIESPNDWSSLVFWSCVVQGLNRIRRGDVTSPAWCVPEKENVSMGEETYTYREGAEKPAVKVVAWSPDAMEKTLRLRITNGNTLQAVDEAGRCLGNLVTVAEDGRMKIYRLGLDKARELGIQVNHNGQPTLIT